MTDHRENKPLLDVAGVFHAITDTQQGRNHPGSMNPGLRSPEDHWHVSGFRMSSQKSTAADFVPSSATLVRENYSMPSTSPTGLGLCVAAECHVPCRQGASTTLVTPEDTASVGKEARPPAPRMKSLYACGCGRVPKPFVGRLSLHGAESLTPPCVAELGSLHPAQGSGFSISPEDQEQWPCPGPAPTHTVWKLQEASPGGPLRRHPAGVRSTRSHWRHPLGPTCPGCGFQRHRLQTHEGHSKPRKQPSCSVFRCRHWGFPHPTSWHGDRLRDDRATRKEREHSKQSQGSIPRSLWFGSVVLV